MNTIQFLGASTDSPRERETKRMTLPVPTPEQWEYRIFFNHRDEEREEVTTDEETGEQSVVTKTVPTAEYVSVQADHEPTDDEWTEVLALNGYTAEQITNILSKEEVNG